MADESARQRRLAENERLIREANWEATLVAVGEGARDDEELELWCACGRAGCSTRLVLTLGEYRAAHARPHQFVVAPGHAIDALEAVVERHARYEVVEKLPEYQGLDSTSR